MTLQPDGLAGYGLALAIAGVGLLVLAAVSAGQTPSSRPHAEVLYNGIELAPVWPPRLPKLTREPLKVPYLKSPPSVIPIDVGRQLFVDDFLIESSTLERSFHRPALHPSNPVLKADQPWEETVAMPFSDGVWFDPADGLFKMWYMAGYCKATAYATSRDGLSWTKPQLDVQKATNIVQAEPRDSSTVWLDLAERDPLRRYKMFRVWEEGRWSVLVHFSPDGIHWGRPVAQSGPCGDRTTVFYNPFRKVWVYGLRAGGDIGRMRYYHEDADVLKAAGWRADRPAVPWIGADRNDPVRPETNVSPQLYNLDAVAYESLMLGLFSIWSGQPAGERPKFNQILVGFSRDGFHWTRGSARPFIAVSENEQDWNWGNVQSAGGCCLIVGGKLYFYASGRQRGRGGCSTGLAVLRRDGFASVAAGPEGGVLTTRPVRFSGSHLFVNVEAPAGSLRVGVLAADGKVIAAHAPEKCLPIRADSTVHPVKWQGTGDLSALAGTPVRFRFHLTSGRLYAFWVSHGPSGASRGYVAAGGPGFTGPTDTVGTEARAGL